MFYSHIDQARRGVLETTAGILKAGMLQGRVPRQALRQKRSLREIVSLLTIADGSSIERRPTITAIRLAAFDVDGTLLRGENICGCIARNIGRSNEMDAFELLRSREEITAGRDTMLQWYLPFGQANLTRHLTELRLAPGVKEGFARLKKAGIKTALVSITWAFAVDWLAAELEADYAVGTGWQTDNTVRHFWPEDKASYLEALLCELSLGPNALAATGDSWGDIPMLNLASKSYFVGYDLPPELSHAEHWPDASIDRVVSSILA